VLPRYNASRSYRWNYDHAPDPVEREIPAIPGNWTFCGLKVDSPLGIAAGPLLNGKWCLYYASLGFDTLTYKTVRSARRGCYPPPNLLPVECGSLDGSESRLQVSKNMQGSWAVSFGMPSADPEIWRRDIEWTRDRLPANKRLCVSVVGTVQPDWSMQQLADDYAICAKWAIESGADVVETNFSCPNVDTCDGQLFQNANGARLVAQTVRAAIGSVPLVIKIGHSTDKAEIHNLLASVGDHATALAMTNSIATTVGPSDERPLFEGQKRGICGKAIHQASVAQVRRVDRIQADTKQQLRWIGVGGIDTFRDVQDYLDAGAEACQLATAVMCDPEVAIKIRASAASERTRS
jgi:dihydroorotate dehydrogenase